MIYLKEKFVQFVRNTVSDCSFDGCNTDAAERAAEKYIEDMKNDIERYVFKSLYDVLSDFNWMADKQHELATKELNNDNRAGHNYHNGQRVAFKYSAMITENAIEEIKRNLSTDYEDDED